MSFVKRSDKVAYYGKGDGTFERMVGFTDISVSKNPREYKRQYVDQDFEQSDVVGFSPSISFAFDQEKGNSVHDDIVSVSDNELMGEDAVKEIVLADFTDGDEEKGYKAVKRSFALIVSSEGNSKESYKYSGTLKVKGDKVFGVVKSEDNFKTVTFTQA